MPATHQPEDIEIHTYQVGFGDCFLLVFKYASCDRHVLIDFGSMKKPKGAGRNHMVKIAKQIKRDCKGSLDIVVATHRHKDHISGFATNKRGTGPGDIIASCKPKIVLQPWTENPNAETDAKTAEKEAVRAFTNSLNSMHSVASSAIDTAKLLRRTTNRVTTDQLNFIGQDNITNESAVVNLMTMGKNYYVNHGDKIPIANILPGVKLHILGPPSLKQSNTIRKQRHRDAEEFWHLQAASSQGIGSSNRDILFPGYETKKAPIQTRWFRNRMRNLQAEMMLSIVRILDGQMNNTSLILLFETENKSLLFPGDAQLENWQYALSRNENTDLLSQVDVYKVGHHGSLNATPKSLWKLFEKKSIKASPTRLKSLLSTLEGFHGHKESGTEVPRNKLVSSLKRNTDFATTQAYTTSELSRVVHLKA